MPAVELEFVEAAVVPEDENCNFIFDQIRSNLSKMDQIGLKRNFSPIKKCYYKIFHLYPDGKQNDIFSNLSKMDQTGSN